MNAPLLVVGGNGLIGSALVARCLQTGQPVVSAARSAPSMEVPSLQLDLSADSWPELPHCSAAVICAAVTRQDTCRQDPAGTRLINVTRTLSLIEKLLARGSFVVFLSTNLVFDGSKPRRRADDPPSPKTEYGRQKAEVEQALLRTATVSAAAAGTAAAVSERASTVSSAASSRRIAIVRLTKVFHPRLPLLQKWVQDLESGRPINAFSDYVCSPISLEQTVSGLLRVALEQRPEVWQFSGPDDVSYCDLADILAHARNLPSHLITAVQTPPSLMEHLPLHTTLDTSRAEKELGMVFPPAQAVIRDLPAKAV